MIVVDTNLVAYLFINGQHSETAEKVLLKDPRWAAPLLWRSELRSVLVKCLRKEFFGTDDAIQIMDEAESLLSGGEYAVATHHGPYDRLGQTYAKLCGQWLPENGYEPRSAPSFEIYRNNPQTTPAEDLLTDVHVPVEAK